MMLFLSHHFVRRLHSLTVDNALHASRIGQTMRVNGWLKGKRKQKQLTFLDVSDGLSAKKLQVIAPTESLPENLSFHSAVRVTGTLRKSDHPAQEVELEASEVQLVNACKQGYPFGPRKKYPDEVVRRYPTYRAKMNGFGCLMRVRNALSMNIHQYFQSEDFIQIQTPILTSNDCEGAGEVFIVRPFSQSICNELKTDENVSDDDAYFDRNVFLTVSGQLHLEAMCNGLSRVYNFSPVFRAERGRTRRHLTEFTMIEAEIAFADNMQVILNVMENLIKKSIRAVIDSEDVTTFAKLSGENNLDVVNALMEKDFAVLTYSEAMNILLDHNDRFQSKARHGDSLGKEHELFLTEFINGPVFVTDWPKESKPFYVREVDGRPDLVLAVDLLLPGVGELCGGSLREHRVDVLEERLKGTGSDQLDWYVDLRRAGSSASGGFGLGFERLVQFLLDVFTLREEYRIIGNLVGTVAKATRQTIQNGLPLLLLDEEIDLLLKKGIVKVVRNPTLNKRKSLYPEQDDIRQRVLAHREDSYQEQVEVYKEDKKRHILEMADVIVEGKRRKKGEEVDREAVIQEEMDRIVNLPRPHVLIQTFNEHPWTKLSDLEEIKWDFPRTDRDRERTAIFSDLWSKGFFLTEGEKFGSDFLAYPGDPIFFHAKYVVLCSGANLNTVELNARCRLGTTVKKTVLLGKIDSGKVKYQALKWTQQKSKE